MKNADSANETDVREEIAAPLVALLGYERGTSNDVRRELTLTYDRVFLGRKKKSDPPLRGRADYVLVVTGAGRWTLEAKAPAEEITQDVVEQALTYARHPEVAGAYAVVLNGRELVVFRGTDTFSDGPLLIMPVATPEEMAEGLMGLLSPAAIRRDCSPPIVDLGRPLAEGLRSRAAVLRGVITYQSFVWGSNHPLQPDAIAKLNEAARRMTDYRSNISGGEIWRDDASRIRAKLEWTAPHAEMLRFIQDKQLMAEFLSLSPVVSADPALPTIFDVVGSVTVREGEQIFDIQRWRSVEADTETVLTYWGQGTGTIRDGCLAGTFQLEQEMIYPMLLGPRISTSAGGTFEIHLDTR